MRLLEIVLSLGLGALLGVAFSFCEKLFHSRSKRMGVAVTFIMLAVGLSSIKFNIGHVHIGFSSLLTCMMLGTVFCNVCDEHFSEELMARAICHELDHLDGHLYVEKVEGDLVNISEEEDYEELGDWEE